MNNAETLKTKIKQSRRRETIFISVVSIMSYSVDITANCKIAKSKIKTPTIPMLKKIVKVRGRELSKKSRFRAEASTENAEFFPSTLRRR